MTLNTIFGLVIVTRVPKKFSGGNRNVMTSTIIYVNGYNMTLDLNTNSQLYMKS